MDPKLRARVETVIIAVMNKHLVTVDYIMPSEGILLLRKVISLYSIIYIERSLFKKLTVAQNGHEIFLKDKLFNSFVLLYPE
jgi:hypothetical protein